MHHEVLTIDPDMQTMLVSLQHTGYNDDDDEGNAELPDGGRLPTPAHGAKFKAVAKAAVQAAQAHNRRLSIAPGRPSTSLMPPPRASLQQQQQKQQQQQEVVLPAVSGGAVSGSQQQQQQQHVDYDYDDDNDHAGGEDYSDDENDNPAGKH